MAAYRIIKIADVPGLIEGAHENRGLGHQFLRHIERTRVLLFVIDIAGQDQRDPVEDFRVLQEELKLHKRELVRKPYLVACNKMDDEPPATENFERFLKEVAIPRDKIFPISCAAGQGLDELVQAAINMLD